MSASPPSIFTATTFFSLGATVAILVVAVFASRIFLPRTAHATDKFTFIWLAFDALIHFILEGSFLYYSMFGRSVFTSQGPLAELWKEYAKADIRWGKSDETVVALEILTVLGAGPLCCYILYQLSKNDPARHFWLVVLSTAEIYGGWMTFAPEWLTGSPNLVTSNFMYLWVYLFFFNMLWVVIPIWIMIDSYGHISSALRKSPTGKKLHRQ
ncbi:hypothetical protein FRB94_004167 [Tulasnella sp. JGI-2019a]|nr:hypothetical protein FRB93_003552 [Tulasnella sp. JGI-2019a]KAG9002017.1 hypothetical protein FRB94_004167 [Tulasnella sp. JGI-2019a]KAG9037286.1 hypothetical protein FRB95_006229 [Tulasnella sp. JGI-2019a]